MPLLYNTLRYGLVYFHYVRAAKGLIYTVTTQVAQSSPQEYYSDNI